MKIKNASDCGYFFSTWAQRDHTGHRWVPSCFLIVIGHVPQGTVWKVEIRVPEIYWKHPAGGGWRWVTQDWEREKSNRCAPAAETSALGLGSPSMSWMAIKPQGARPLNPHIDRSLDMGCHWGGGCKLRPSSPFSRGQFQKPSHINTPKPPEDGVPRSERESWVEPHNFYFRNLLLF